MATVFEQKTTLPRTGGVFGWMKAIASKLVNTNEFRGMDRSEFEQIARDLNLSPLELQALSSNDRSGELLDKRLAEFELSAQVLRRQHPEVLRDLQRVCGMCSSVKRCANEFERPTSGSGRSDYCPNTQTLQALEQEHLSASKQASEPIGPCCC
jgi:hypothetical protein